MEIFHAPDIEMSLSGEGTRASGAFLNANSAACMLGFSLMLAVASVRLQESIFLKYLFTLLFLCFLAGYSLQNIGQDYFLLRQRYF